MKLIYFLITNPQKRSLLLKSIQQKLPNLMIKKDNHFQLEKKSNLKNQIQKKFLQQQTGSDTPKKMSFKSNFIQWLKQLPLDQRYLALKVHAPGLSKKIQETLIDLQNDHIQQSKKDGAFNKKINPKYSKQIIDSIVLISDGQQYFDNIGFDFSYIQHPQKLYQLLTLPLSQPQKQMYLTEQYQIQPNQLKDTILEVQKSQSKQQLAFIIMNFLRGQIFIQYQQKRTFNIEQQRNRKKQFSVFWRNLSEQYKRKILLLFKQDTKSLSNFLSDKNIILCSQDLQKQIADLIQLDKNEFCNKIFKCKLRRSLTYFTDYHQLIYKTWKNQLNKKKRKQRSQRSFITQKPSNQTNRSHNNQVNQKLGKRPTNKLQKQAQKNQNTGIQKQKSSKIITTLNKIHPNLNNNNTINPSNQTNEQTTKRKRKRNNNRRKKSVSAQSKQTKATQYKFTEDQVLKIQEDQKIQIKYLDEQEEIHINNKQILNNPEILKSQIKIPFIDYKKQIFQKLALDIQEYSDLINQQANQFHQRRVIAYERIQFMLSLWKIPIKLFGSCASGITIKNSDIDIAVDNTIINYFLHIPENHRLKAALQQLELFFGQQPWITNLKLIKTAAIPLIKMTVNTSVQFVDFPGMQIYPDYLNSLNRDHLSSGEIQIDLTIETFNKQNQCNHLGIISTNQINNWIKTIRPLHSIVIIIKNYLTKMNLNITYEGGLNTYSMICMIVGFIKHDKLENESDVIVVLQKLVKFYAYQFQQKQKGIDLLNQNQIYYDKYDKIKLNMTKSLTVSQRQNNLPELKSSKSVGLSQAELQIKDPLNNGKIMTRNCYLFPKIKDVFRKIHQICIVGTQKQLQNKFTQLYKQKIQSASDNNSTEQSLLIRIQQLLKQCKAKIGNPFITLFE